MPAALTELTEIATALGILAPSTRDALRSRPSELLNVSDSAWDRLTEMADDGQYATSFETAFENGRAFFGATAGLRGRVPIRVEWKGPHRPPGDDVIPADLRVDHVFLISCKYLSKVLLNPGPRRLFERLLTGETRERDNWFAVCAPDEFQAFYDATVAHADLRNLPKAVTDLSRDQQRVLRGVLTNRSLPDELVDPWRMLCAAVASESARRWRASMTSRAATLRLLWRMLRISGATYFVLGTDRSDHIRLQVDSTWDWNQRFELIDLDVSDRAAGQAEVAWQASVLDRNSASERVINGHVEVRWSHGRFVGAPEAKLYLDTPHALVPGYAVLV